MNTYQALHALNVDPNASLDDIRSAYRKLALEYHPDKNLKEKEGSQFKKVTEAYHFLKKQHKDERARKSSHVNRKYTDTKSNKERDFEKKPKWGAPPGDKIPEEDWGKYTRPFEEAEPEWWKEYERKFWENYNAHINSNGMQQEYEKTKEPKVQPNLSVNVDKSLCIGCCSCEIIAPEVFFIDRNSKMNPKSSVINQKGAGINKIMNAAQTCPTKAIIVDDIDARERLYPF